MRLAAFLALALSAAALAGCATEGDAFKSDFNELRHDTYAVQQDVQTLRADLGRLKEGDPAREESLRALKLSQAAILDQLASLDSEVKALRGSSEEERHLAEKIANEQSQETLALRQKVDSIEKALNAQEQKIGQIEASVQELSKPKEEALTPEKEYDRAYAMFGEGRNSDARAAFAEFLKKNASHELAGNAQFWIAETYYRDKDYETAVLSYEDVLKKYPQSRKVPAALYKQALSFIEMKDTKVAVALLKELAEKHPDSEEAKAAQSKLAELQPGRKK
jgi:tol-pal system protein YbgF